MKPVEIGNAQGRIALYLDREEAEILADLYGWRDGAYDEIHQAIKEAYPDESR